MVQFVFPLTDQITEMGSVRTPYITGKHRLFKAVIPFTEAIATADLAAIEADFTGYTEVTYTTCGPVFVDSLGGVSFECSVAIFVDTAITVGNSIYGGWIEDAGGNLLVAWQVAIPFSMVAPLDTMNVVLLVNRFGTRGVVVVVNGVVQ